MRAKTVAELVAVIPTAWSTPGIFGIDAFTSGPSRSYYSGLAIVDGTVVTHSFEDAVRHGLVDVPLIMGSMGQEPELMPDQRVRGMTKSAWNALLQTSFASWKNQANSLVADLFLYYQADASLDVQRSYDTLSTDIGLSCALRNIALAGKEGNYSSPIYLYVNQWQPSVPVNGGDWNLTWAFHTWDYTVAFQNWPTATLGSFPQKSDSELNVYLTEAWRQLIYHGRLNASSLNGWKSVEEVSGFPVHYVVQRISSPDLIPYETTSFQEDLKGRICSILHKYEFGSNEWWVN